VGCEYGANPGVFGAVDRKRVKRVFWTISGFYRVGKSNFSAYAYDWIILSLGGRAMSFFGSRNSILVFTVLTALIHLGLGFSFMSQPDFFGELFILNGLGYLVLMYALLWTPSFLAGQKALVRWAFIGFTALTFILYFVMNGAGAFMMNGSPNIAGLADKLIEALLIFSLWRYSK
jgi:hypothetical protein